MKALRLAQNLRRHGFVTGPNFLQYIWWENGRFSESEGIFSDSRQLSWKEVKRLLKLKAS